MPRIRKKTSKRGTTHKRQRIQHKVAESRKKSKKEAKKNTQWKTKHPKDPGIPNNFPFKDQILAEVAEERRLAAEEKQRRKEEKRAGKTNTVAEDGSEGENEGAFDGVKSLTGSLKTAPTKKTSSQWEPAVDEEDEPVPVLINPDLPNLRAVLNVADVVVEVLDARDPLPTRSAELETLAKDKNVLLVLNKIDTCPREAIASWTTTLRAQYPVFLFRSASASLPSIAESALKGKGKARADDAWGVDAVLACLGHWAGQKAAGAPLTVAVIGITNVGKSSFVNSLLRKTALSTYKLTSSPSDSPTTTTHPQEVTIEHGGHKLRLIDTPGIAWQPSPDASLEDTTAQRARDILLRNRGRIERLKEPGFVLSDIVSRANQEDLMLLYNLPTFPENDANSFLAGIARANNLIKKGGAPDIAGASRIVLRDWSTGKIARYTTPLASSSSSSTPADSVIQAVYDKDDLVLSKLPTRKELRKAGGLVKLTTGVVDSRKIALDTPWVSEITHSSDEDNGDQEEEESGEEEDDSEEDEDEDEDAEEDELMDDEPPSPPLGKRKRGSLKPPPARPAKKVAFAAEPKGTKRARAAGSKGPKTSKTQPTAKPPAKALTSASTKKTANPPSKPAAGLSKDGEAAYDFKQFF